MIEVRGLSHVLGGREVLAIPALTLAREAITALVGRNGSGKSTLLRVLALVETPTQGTLRLDGGPLDSHRARRAARQRVTLVEQRPYLFSGSVRQNLLAALGMHGITGPQAAARAAHALDRLGLADLADRARTDLSEGERLRVAVARALALEPAVLFLDEPTAAVDRQSAIRIYHELQRERDRGATVCFASHQLEDAYRWSDHLLALEEGRLTPVTPENLFRVELPPGDGLKAARIGEVEVYVVTDVTGPATLAIPPEDITLSRAPQPSSARNRYHGVIRRIHDDGRGRVTVTADAGIELTTRITAAALAELHLAVGHEVAMTFKAMAVRVF